MANNNQSGNDRNVNHGSGTSKRGFASMDQQKQREIASKGGKASAEGDTSNRGFASMDGEKQRMIASEGGKASGVSRRNNSMRNRSAMHNTNLSGSDQSELNQLNSDRVSGSERGMPRGE